MPQEPLINPAPVQPVPAQTGVVTLLFTDIVSSTALKQHLGDLAGAVLIQKQRALVRQLLAAYPGAEEIETAGDSFLLAFLKPSDAVKFALVLQGRLRGLNQGQTVPLQERIGIHLGEVVIEQHKTGHKPKDLYGVQIDTCARVMSLAKACQTLMTRGVFDNARQVLKGEDLEGVGQLEWLNHGPYLLKGLDEPVEICEVRQKGQEPMPGPPTSSEKAQRQERADQETVLGWRPAVGQLVPNTRWVLEKKLGEGGFGEVWLGRHPTTKEPRVFKFCFQAERVRFLKRELTLFRLLKERVGDHPHLVRLHDVCFDHPPFYVEMDYVAGADLRTWCHEHGGVAAISLETRLEIVAQVADALQAAHQAGIIHRDIKPANILIGGKGIGPAEIQVKLTDFGIGQVVSEEYLKGITQAGFTRTMMAESSSSKTGTQMYMAPELLAGNPATTRSDLYSLGVVCYQLVVGAVNQPLTSDWAEEIADPLLRDDVRHCVAGKPEDRFAGAGQLAKSLRAYRERQAELERRRAELAERERLQIQAERRRRMLVAGGLIGLVLVVLAAALGYGMREAQRERERQRQMAYASDMKAAQVAVQQNNRGLALNLLERHVPKAGQADLRGIEWRYLWREANGTEIHSLPHALGVNDLAFSPDHGLLATATWDKWIQVWDIASEQQVHELQGAGSLPPKRCLGFTSDGKRFVFRGRSGIEVCETSGWTVLTNLPCAGNSPLVLSHNGRRLVFQVETTAGIEMQAWDLHTWECWKLPGHATVLYGLAVNADGTLAVHGWRSSIFLWDIPGNTCTQLVNESDVLAFAFSPDGNWLASGHVSGRIELWDLRTRQRLHSWSAHPGLVNGLAFSPDSTRLASGGNDQVIAFWQAGTTNLLAQLKGHGGEIQCLTFSRDGRYLASGSSDNTAKIWDLQTNPSADQTRVLKLPTNALPICPSADGTGLFTLNWQENAAAFWSLQSGQVLWSCSGSSLPSAEDGSLAYFLKPRLAIGLSANRLLRVWDLTTRHQLQSVPLPISSLQPACLSPDRRWLVAQVRGTIRLFDLRVGRQVPGFKFGFEFVFAVDFAPDNQLLAFSTWHSPNQGDHDIHLWDLKAGQERLSCHSRRLYLALCFSPDSRLLASGDYGGDVQLWSAETGQLLWHVRKGHQAPVKTCSFSADGKTLITSGEDSTLRLWSVAAGQEVLSFDHTLSISEDLLMNYEMVYRPQAAVNPVPNTLVWQELGRGTRLITLPVLADIDHLIAHRREQLAEEARRSEARQFQKDRPKAIARDPGALKQWLILGPIPLAVGQTEIQALDTDLVPNEAGLRPRAGERTRTTAGELVWRSVRLSDYVIDFNELLGESEHAAVYAVAYLSVPAARSNLKLLVSSDDQAKIYLNGQPVYRQTQARSVDPDQDVVLGIELKTGPNVLVFKVVNGVEDWGGCVRFTDSAGNPVPGLSVGDSPP